MTDAASIMADDGERFPDRCAGDEALPPADRIAQLEAEIDAKREEIRRIRAAETADEVAQTSDNGKGEHGSKDPLDLSEHLGRSLGDLIALWEQRLEKNRKRGSVVVEDESTAPSESPPATIDASQQNDISVTSNDVTSPTPSPRRTNVFLENILSPFNSPKKAPRSSVDTHDLERMVQERDEKISDLEAVISSCIEITEQMKHTIEYMADAITSPQQNAQLQRVLLEKIDEERSALESCGNGPVKALSSVFEDAHIRAEVCNLQDNVKDLESTVALQETQQETLKEELTRLQDTIDETNARNSNQEDKIELMKAEIMKLELRCDMVEYDRRMMEDSMNKKVESRDLSITHLVETHRETVESIETTNSWQEDQIEKLKADLTKLQIRYDLQEEEKQKAEEEKRQFMDEMKLRMELFHLEDASAHDISSSV